MRIFISYCHDDVMPDDGRLKVFVDALEDVGKGTYDVLVDYKHKKAALGESLPQFMQEIDTVDAIILLLTPGYRERVERKGSSGVYFEFRRIYDRLLESLSKRTYDHTFVILPLIFIGSFKDSCPSEIKHIHCEDLTWLHVIPKSQKPKIRREIQAKFSRVISDVSARINAIAETRMSSYDQRKEKIFRKFLFQETKSAWDKPESYKYFDTAFVKTSVFIKARDHEISFIVGRKGAGKSALTHVLPLFSEPKPSVIMRVDFEDLPLSSYYNIFAQHPAEASDLRTAFLSIHSYQLAWDVFFHLYFIWQVWGNVSDDERSRMPKTIKKMINSIMKSTGKTERNSVATRTFFEYSLEQLEFYIGQIITGKDSVELPGLTGLMSNFTVSGFRENIFGRKGWGKIDEILSQYKKTDERIVVTADGFDTLTGFFTTESANSNEAARFERELLLSLFQIVLNKGPARIVGGSLYEISDFYVAVPHDRFPEIRLKDRDRYRYRNVARIAWSGIELSSLARKRLALLKGVPDFKAKAENISIEERLNLVMNRGYPELPNEISFQFGSANYRMPLFIYILRHTFWRPRDVLHYYANLLAASDGSGKEKVVMPVEFVRQVIAGSTRNIVEDEFIAEFETSFRNLKEVLSRFRHGSQVITWDELKKKIENIRFETILYEGEIASLEWKVEILYDLGALGVILDRKTSERLSAYRHAFSFNEDQLLTQKLAREDYPNFKYALNPILVEYLQLDTTNNPELILPMDWKYLHDNEILRGIVSRV